MLALVPVFSQDPEDILGDRLGDPIGNSDLNRILAGKVHIVKHAQNGEYVCLLLGFHPSGGQVVVHPHVGFAVEYIMTKFMPEQESDILRIRGWLQEDDRLTAIGEDHRFPLVCFEKRFVLNLDMVYVEKFVNII